VIRYFIGTYPCNHCNRQRVRVYDWLPECVLCAKCKAQIAAQEALQEDKNEEP
jgi:hypothetical protein